MNEYVPMLIVGLNENEEYIHIRNAKNDESYICPCCGAKIKARAMKSNKVQPHFYHSEGSECSEENIAHWIYKNWLFGFGCKFIINKDGSKKEYTVDSVSIEETHSTKFGLYKPDITVNTTSGDTLYFEIYYSNKKDVDNYYCKWNELGNDVVEVNTRELIYSNINQSTPMFNVIYSNGEYLKLYIEKGKRDIYANTIKVYKDAISKTACENLKKRFEQLDWFWIMLQKYRLQKVSSEEIINIFNLMELEDKYKCYELSKRLKCIDLNNLFKENIIKDFNNHLDDIKENLISNNNEIIKIIFNFEKQSSQIIFCNITIKTVFKNYTLPYRFRTYDGLYTYDVYKYINNNVENLLNNFNEDLIIYRRNKKDIDKFCNTNKDFSITFKKDGNVIFKKDNKNLFSCSISSCDYYNLQKLKEEAEKNKELKNKFNNIRRFKDDIESVLVILSKDISRRVNHKVEFELDFFPHAHWKTDVTINAKTEYRTILSHSILDISEDNLKNKLLYFREILYPSILHAYELFDITFNNLHELYKQINNCKNNLWISTLQQDENEIRFSVSLYKCRQERGYGNGRYGCVYYIDTFVNKNIDSTEVKNNITREMNFIWDNYL